MHYMKEQIKKNFLLDNFEGPIELLLFLIQKSEVDIYEVPIADLIRQYSRMWEEEPDLDTGAEFIGSAATLHWLKTVTLLPKHEQQNDLLEQEELDGGFNIIHHLLDYCRFKEAAKELSHRENRQLDFFPRGLDSVPEAKKNLGIEHLSLDDLAILFKELIAKAAPRLGVIYEEVWRVSDKIRLVRELLKGNEKIHLISLFSSSASKDELIVTFLAILELMKTNELKVVKEIETNEVNIVKARS